jgi:hypothetical protein
VDKTKSIVCWAGKKVLKSVAQRKKVLHAPESVARIKKCCVGIKVQSDRHSSRDLVPKWTTD